MTFEYYMIEETFKTETETEYVTYGIAVKNENSVVATVSDISTDKAKVLALAELCNRQKLHPMQLKEVVEDMLDVTPWH